MKKGLNLKIQLLSMTIVLRWANKTLLMFCISGQMFRVADGNHGLFVKEN